jgi:hypothetical protein
MHLLDEIAQIAHSYSTMGKAHSRMSTHVCNHQMDGKLQAYDLFETAHLELALLKLDNARHMMSSSV